MEVILKQDVHGLGYKNDLITVKDGYARNYLIPQQMAMPVTKRIARYKILPGAFPYKISLFTPSTITG